MTGGGLAAGLALLLVTACGDGEGPLRAGSGGGVCTPAKPGSSVAVGIDVLELQAGSGIEVTSAQLVDAQSLTAGEVVLVPLSGKNSFGTHSEYPPSASDRAELGLQDDWAARQRVPTGPLVAGDAAQALNLVLELRPSAERGTAAGVRLTYHDGRRERTVTTSHELVVVTPPQTCADAGR